MFIFNFIGLAFAAAGIGSAFLFTWPMSGLFQDYTYAALIAGSLLASALDFRYRWIGEDAPPPDTAKTMTGYMAESASSLWRLTWNLLWPWSGGQILFVPIWLAFPAVIALDAFGWLSFLHTAAPKVTV